MIVHNRVTESRDEFILVSQPCGDSPEGAVQTRVRSSLPHESLVLVPHHVQPSGRTKIAAVDAAGQADGQDEVAAGCGRDAIGRLFRFVWRDGSLPGEPAFAELLRDLAVTPQALDEAPVKDALRANGEEAIAAGVFGVPTAVAHTTRGVRAIWGFESLPMLTDWLRDAPVFGSEEMRRAADLPMGEQRRSFGR